MSQMNIPTTLIVDLLSESTFGGANSSSEVDTEVEHDELGLPFIKGKTLHGLLRDGWLAMAEHMQQLDSAAVRILGPPRDFDENAILCLSDAVLMMRDRDRVAAWLRSALDSGRVCLLDILRTLTMIRHQTAEDRATGTPERNTLRSIRVLHAGLSFSSSLTWLQDPEPDELRCLARCVLCVRNAGLGRTRGSGHVALSIRNDANQDITLTLAR